MKKVFVSFLFIALIVSCKNNVKENNSGSTQFESVFKVSGIDDSVKANSVSMIIRNEGIQSVYLNKADSIVSVKADVGVIDQDKIKDEIESCGVEIIKTF
jgi:hypothetical protein